MISLLKRFVPLALLFALGAAALPASADPALAVAASPITPTQLLSALRHNLADHFRLEGDFQIEFVRPWTPPDRTAAAWDVVMSEYPPVPAGTMLVRCTLLADGAVAEEATLFIRAYLWRDVWFARDPLANGATFDPAVLESRRVDCLREPDALPSSVGDGSYMFARQVPASHMLSWRDIARRPLVRKGEVVDVIAEEGPLLVTMKALAVQSGAQGDVVTVRNLETRKDITGEVVSEDRVQIRF